MDQFPNEIWDAIFRELVSQADLARVIRTCKKFYAIGIRVLHRHIVWLDPARFTASLDFIQRNPTLHSIPRSLKLGVSLNYDCFRHKTRPSREPFHALHLSNDLDAHDDAFFADANPFFAWGQDHHPVVENHSPVPGPSHHEPGPFNYPGAQALFNGFDPAALTNVHSWSDGPSLQSKIYISKTWHFLRSTTPSFATSPIFVASTLSTA
ncbi:hypothetical protein CONPUDRAFT_161605 [Coniophora puteana RWD-64-598 SS2]|uniref:F-box domain-containing protein n=1 Tax=Coniophora puteana (strain RWD-64-598) TaxID=741705 RepID=A0A5M3N6B4_CONPW|nr:uncharacterized protein CONPUDRAFT_161605 [Coniophora puteana RWD-64-598 SS2]EIW86982.1 hypothetical protein CONPUDRAFT_161605 [Coniophora puteana RWD-64-598 SS2]